MHLLIVAIVFVLVLSVLVIAHEWGHFIAARMCGIRVDEFSIGFGPRAARVGRLGDTEYNIRWIPLGGFVKIAGMEPDEEPLMRAAGKVKSLAGSKDTPQSDVPAGDPITRLPLIAENVPNVDETAEQRMRDQTEGFYAHPIWQRSWVIFAGPLMSFLLGYVIVFVLFMTIGAPDGPLLPRVDAVNPASRAQKMGLQAGDVVESINGQRITSGDQMVGIIHGSVGKLLHVVVQRAGRMVALTGTPGPMTSGGKTVGILGFVPAAQILHYPPREALSQTNWFTASWFARIGSLIRNHSIRQIRSSAGGPIFIAQATNQAVEDGGASVPLLMAQLSMSLALFNLLPIPILDGGHLLIFAIEAVRRGRRLTMEQQQSFMLAGLAVIGVLFVLIMFNDIMRNIHP